MEKNGEDPRDAKDNTQMKGSTNLQSGDQGFEGQTTGPATRAVPIEAVNLGLADLAFAMELDDEATNKGEEGYCVLKFGPKKGDSSQGR